MGNAMSIQDQVRNYILENFLFTRSAATFADGDSFLERGIIDSTGVLELIFFVEEQFGIKVADNDMVPDNFDSVNNIARFVQGKQAAA
jgi:acyl carrier protein